MAYLPDHEADVFVSYSHEDDADWVRAFVEDLHTELKRGLRAKRDPVVFFDRKHVDATQAHIRVIPAAVDKSAFFIALLSPRYVTSDYCKMEMQRFLDLYPPDRGRLIQARIITRVRGPFEDIVSPLDFGDRTGPFSAGSSEYRMALRRVSEPIITTLDELYAKSKKVYLGWADDQDLVKEKERLGKELAARGLTLYESSIARFEKLALRDALEGSSVAVFFLSASSKREEQEFQQYQLDLARDMAVPTVLATIVKDDPRQAAPGLPAPIYIHQGNPTTTIANEIDRLLGRGKRNVSNPHDALTKSRLVFVFEPMTDAVSGRALTQKLKTRGGFDVVVPPYGVPDSVRFEDLERARAAMLYWGKAERKWLDREVEALNVAAAMKQQDDLPIALYQKSSGTETPVEGVQVVVRSDEELDTFLGRLHDAASA